MVLKARLRLILMADAVVVAETEDPQIWQAAFEAIQGGIEASAFDARQARPEVDSIDWVPEEERVAIHAFADELDVQVKDVMAACHPRTIAPYIFLNKLHWEAFKRQIPERGRNSISNAVLAATLLLLWAEKINLERVSLRDAMAVLRAIAARDEHASRAVDNCPWLNRGYNRMTLNPDEISKAIAIGRAFCLKQAPVWDDAG